MKAGLFNIGAQGQLLLGAIFAAWVGYRSRDADLLHVPLGLIVGGLFGMIPAALAGILKAYRGAHEVITTIMLNAILDQPDRVDGRRPGPVPRPRGRGHLAHTGDPRTAEIPRVRLRLPGRVLPRRHRRHRHLVLRRPHESASRSPRSARTRRRPVRRHLGGPHHRGGDGRQRLPRRAGRVDRDARGVRPVRVRAATSGSASTGSPSPCWPGSTRSWPSPRRCCSG